MCLWHSYGPRAPDPHPPTTTTVCIWIQQAVKKRHLFSSRARMDGEKMSKETTEKRGERAEGNGNVRIEKGAEKKRKTSRNKDSKRNPLYPLR